VTVGKKVVIRDAKGTGRERSLGGKTLWGGRPLQRDDIKVETNAKRTGAGDQRSRDCKTFLRAKGRRSVDIKVKTLEGGDENQKRGVILKRHTRVKEMTIQGTTKQGNCTFRPKGHQEGRGDQTGQNEEERFAGAKKAAGIGENWSDVRGRPRLITPRRRG